jgi:hypothetical protein
MCLGCAASEGVGDGDGSLDGWGEDALRAGALPISDRSASAESTNATTVAAARPSTSDDRDGSRRTSGRGGTSGQP